MLLMNTFPDPESHITTPYNNIWTPLNQHLHFSLPSIILTDISGKLSPSLRNIILILHVCVINKNSDLAMYGLCFSLHLFHALITPPPGGGTQGFELAIWGLLGGWKFSGGFLGVWKFGVICTSLSLWSEYPLTSVLTTEQSNHDWLTWPCFFIELESLHVGKH